MSVEPKIGKVPISGDAKNAQPILLLTALTLGGVTVSETWACVEVMPNNDGVMDKYSKVEVVHRNAPLSASDAVGRHPLALILWNNGRPGKVFPVTYFNLRYVRTTGANNTRKQHFFL